MSRAESGTDLYRRVLAFDHDDAETNAAIREVWSGTPWIIDVLTHSPGDDHYRAMVEWLTENFGPQAWPIHGKFGAWHFGCATVNGWTWLGFAREVDMLRFIEAWPDSVSDKQRASRKAVAVSRTIPLIVFGLSAGGIAVHTQQAQPSLLLTSLSVAVVVVSFVVGHMTGQMAEWDKRASRGRNDGPAL